VTVLGPPLDMVSTDARAYPADLLPEGGTALALFAAAFLGANDSIHFARKDMYGTCVDTNEKRLREMSLLYPESWIFVNDDAWEFAERVDFKWDVVSADTFLGNATERSLQTLDLWCSLAEKMVTATIPRGQSPVIPDGWRAQIFPRSAIASWLVLQRD
jgi:hypothetical protein